MGCTRARDRRVPSPARESGSQPSSFLSRGASVACPWSCGIGVSASRSASVRRITAAPRGASRAASSPAVSPGPMGVALAQEHVAGVHARIHLERGDAGLRLAADDGPGDGSGAAIAREQGGMDVDGAARGDVEHGLGQDLAEGHHHRDLGAELREPLGPARVSQARRLQDRDPGRPRALLHRRGGDTLAPPGGPVRLGDDRDHVMGAEQRLEGRHGEGRRPVEEDPQRSPATARRRGAARPRAGRPSGSSS